MRIVFDADFDSGAWPGPAGARNASIGEMWTGPKGFLSALETGLGLGGLYPSSIERALGLVKALEANQGFWSNSAKVDPVGSAQRILTLRDELWLCGWRGQGTTKRLRELAKAVRDAKPGLPDRLAAIASALGKRSAGIDQLELYEDPERMPAAWRVVVEGLERQGTQIVRRKLQPAKAGGDLAAALADGFTPSGDGSLQMLRAAGHLESAEEVAALISSMDDRSSRVVIWPDQVLDQALHRHGLPTLGESSGSDTPALVAVMPLVLALGWGPADPRQAAELLGLQDGPVPARIAGELLDALQEWPAVGSRLWTRVLERSLAGLSNAEQRSSVAERIKVIFSAPVARGAGYPAAEVERRLNVLDAWLRGRLAKEQGNKEPCQAAIKQVLAMRRMVQAYPRQELSRMDLGLLQEDAGSSTSAPVLPNKPAHFPEARAVCLLCASGRRNLGQPILVLRFRRLREVQARNPPARCGSPREDGSMRSCQNLPSVPAIHPVAHGPAPRGSRRACRSSLSQSRPLPPRCERYTR